jgi:hypothetical protein
MIYETLRVNLFCQTVLALLTEVFVELKEKKALLVKQSYTGK